MSTPNITAPIEWVEEQIRIREQSIKDLTQLVAEFEQDLPRYRDQLEKLKRAQNLLEERSPAEHPQPCPSPDCPHEKGHRGTCERPVTEQKQCTCAGNGRRLHTPHQCPSGGVSQS